MALDLPLIATADLHDEAEAWPVGARELVGAGVVTAYVRDAVTAPDGSTLRREWLRHPGAVGVVALDEDDTVVLVRQYRHPVQHRLWEVPAGLLDVPDEQAAVAAARELAEEAMVAAERWHTLTDLFCSPGSTEESVRLFLARDLRVTARPEGFEVAGEEADMELARVGLDDLVDAVLDGRLQNPLVVAGVLATREVLRREAEGGRARPADAPWPARAARAGALVPGEER